MADSKVWLAIRDSCLAASRVRQERFVFRHLGGLQQAGIGRRITRLVGAEALEISRIGHDHAELFELT